MSDNDGETLLPKQVVSGLPWKRIGLVGCGIVGVVLVAGGIYGFSVYRRGIAYMHKMQDEKTEALSLGGKKMEWYRLNDVVMGGRSTSQLAADKTGLKFWGEISIIGGGFASFTSQDQSLDLPDSVTGIRVKAVTDGQLYKLVIRTADIFEMSTPSSAYAEFGDFPDSTLEAGKEVTFVLPLSKFIASRRGQPVQSGTVDASKIRSVGVNLSYLDMHGKSNPHFGPGDDSKSWPFEFKLVEIAAV